MLYIRRVQVPEVSFLQPSRRRGASLSPETGRKKTKTIDLGGVKIGGDAPVVVQSMTSTDTRDVAATVEQIHALEKVGCEIVRVAIPDDAAAEALQDIRSRIHIPLIADIHFQPNLALLSMDHGADAIRINPGNIPTDGIRQIVAKARALGKVIRIGINAGSLEKEIASRHGGPTAGALVESALKNIALLEGMGFRRHQALAQVLRRQDHDRRLPRHLREERLPAPPGGHGGRDPRPVGG